MSAPDPLAGAAQEWFKKGTDAMQRQNFDFAVECFGNAVKMKPDVVLYRQTKHGCCRKMYGDNGSGARMAGMKLMTVRGRAKKARMSKDWKTLDTVAEEGLLINPWDPQMYADIGTAAQELDRTEIAIYALRESVKGDEKNISALMILGYALRDNGQYDEARKCFKRVMGIDPTNGEARSMMGKLDAESVMDRGGYDKAESTRDAMADTNEKPATNAYEEDRKARKGKDKSSVAPGESVEMDLKAAIRKDPENVALYQKLADIQRDNRELNEAMQTLDKALELVPKNVGLIEIREDIELEALRDRLAEASERHRKYPDRENLKNKYDKLRQQEAVRWIEIFAARVENHPNDMRMKFDLAERYRKTKQFQKAIPLLQQTVADSRLKDEALVGLGECFTRSGKADLGRRQFIAALETLNAKDKPDAFKSANYFLGRLYEKAKKIEEAQNHYNEILAVDYEYRDVLKRLEELEGGDEFSDFDD